MVSPGKPTPLYDDEGYLCGEDQQTTDLRLDDPQRIWRITGSLEQTLTRLNNLGTTLHQQEG
jgi:hypothetical protein